MNEIEIMQDIRDDFLEEHGFRDYMHAYACSVYADDEVESESNDIFALSCETYERREKRCVQMNWI